MIIQFKSRRPMSENFVVMARRGEGELVGEECWEDRRRYQER